MSQPLASTPSIHFKTCPLCEATCGLRIEVQDGEVVRIRGDADDVFSRGYVCPKGASLKGLHEDPDRLRAPLLRDGDIHRTACWDEAFDVIERGLMPVLEAHGRNSVGVYLGNPNAHNLAGAFYGRPLLKGLGTRNIYSASTLDQIPRQLSSGLLYGTPGLLPVPDIDRTDYLLMLGANPLESNGSLCTAPDFPGRLKALRERGARLVVVDPRRTRTAALADEHVAVQPGTDVLLLLGMANHLFARGSVDLGAAAGCVTGISDAESLVRPFTPEAVAGRVRIDAATIARLAEELAEARSAAVYGRIGTNTVEFGTLTSWAIDLLALITGNLDRPGGLMWPESATGRASKDRAGGRGFTIGRWKSRVKGMPEVMGELPVVTLADEIETPGEGQIRAMIVIGGNPVLSAPNGRRLDEAFGRLDFMVSVDPYCNETSRHADVILPPPSPLERSHYDAAFYGLSVRNVVNYSAPVFETDQLQESDILGKLAAMVMGQGAKADPGAVDDLLVSGLVDMAIGNEASPLHGRDKDEVISEIPDRPGPERALDVLLRSGPYGAKLSLTELEAHPHGIDLGPLQPRLPGALRTASGTIELVPPPIAADFERLGEFLDRPVPELVLVGRRHVRSNNSWMHNVESLVRGRPRCTLQLHPDDAKRLRLDDGASARVRSRVGELVAPVEVTNEVRVGVASLPHGWGHDVEGVRLAVASAHAGVNSNLLTDDEAFDSLSGTVVLNGIPVTVEALAE